MPKAEKTPLPKSTGHRSKQPYNSGFPPPDLRSDDPNEFNFTVSSITTGIGSSPAATHSPTPLTVTVNNGSHSELIPTQGIVTGDDNYDLGLTEIILPSNVSVITANILNYALLDELTLVVRRYLLTVNVILTDHQIVKLLNDIPNIFSDSLLKDLLANFNSLIKNFEIIPGWARYTADGRKLLNDHMDHINFIPRNIIGDGNIPNKCILKQFSTFQQNSYPKRICPARLEGLTKGLHSMFPVTPVLTQDEAAQYAYTITVRLDVMVNGTHYIITLKLNPHDPSKTYTNERFNNFIVSDDFKGKVIAAISSYPVTSEPEATNLKNLCTAIQGNWGIDATKCKFVIIESGCARVNQVVDSTGKLDIRLKPYDNTKYLSKDNRPYVRLFSRLKPDKVIRVFLPNDNWFNAIDQWSDKASPVIFKLNDGSDDVPSTGAVMAEGDEPNLDDVGTPREHTPPSVEKLQRGLASVMDDAEKLVVRVSGTECTPAEPAAPAAPAAPATTAMGTRTTIINIIRNWCSGALTTLNAFTGSRSGGVGGGYVLRPLFHKIPTITAKRGRNGLKGRKRLISRNGRNGRKKGRKGRQMTRKVILACSHLRRSNKKLK